VQRRVHKECIDQAHNFISELLEEIHIVSLQERVLVENKAMKSVRWLGEGNEFLQTHSGVEEFSVAKSAQT
jgi:hypothetical protein